MPGVKSIAKHATDWRAQYLLVALERARSQLEADESYEDEQFTTKKTLACLRNIASLAADLGAHLQGLSPMGHAAIASGGRIEGQLRTAGSRDLVYIVPHLALAAERAAVKLRQMHAPMTEEDGQGANSSLGRESDLRAVRADDGRASNALPFRQPKDKFAISVIEALIRHQHPLSMVEDRGSSRALSDFLNLLWSEMNRPPVNWERVVRRRRHIAEALVGRSRPRVRSPSAG